MRWLSKHLTAALVSALLLVCGSVSTARAQQLDAQRQAREAYSAGVAAFSRGDNQQAYDAFITADATFNSPNIKLMLARTLIRLKRRSEAYAILREALASAHEAGGARYELTARAVSHELRELERALAIVNLRVDDPTGRAVLRVGNREIARDAWDDPIAAEPGTIPITLVARDGRSDAKRLEMTAGSAASLAMVIPAAAPPDTRAAPAPVVLPPPPAATRSADAHALRSYRYAAIGVGSAGLLAFGLLGALANSDYTAVAKACPSGSSCTRERAERAARGRTYQTVADVALGLGVTALGAAVVLWAIELPHERARLALTPQGARLSGAF